ncbi:hypothetical protein, partial [Xenorhabdus sp. SGI240]|uniref:hypothetical protein n=1 Tax=Xenorhabdus sp. SGI240 TaxID=3158262 RepID=UPI0032B85BD9
QFTGTAAQAFVGKPVIFYRLIVQSSPKYRHLAQTNYRNSAPNSVVGNVFLAGKSARIFMPERFQNITKKIM